MIRVSVCIPTYRPSIDHLRHTIESVLSQVGSFELEIVVRDDASDMDFGTLERDLPTVHFHYNDRNLGMVGNWNACVESSHGDYVMLLGQDDILLPGLISRYVSAFQKHSDAVMCSCAREFIDDKGSRIAPRRAVNDRKNIFVSRPVYLLDYATILRLCLRNGNAIGEPSCVMYRRRAFERLGGYDPDFQHAADLDFNLRASALGNVVYFREPGTGRRLHAQRLTHSNRRLGHVARERTEIYRRHARAHPACLPQLDAFRAYLVATAVRDLVHGLGRPNTTIIRQSIKTIRRYGRLAPLSYGRYLLEIIRRKNRDAM